MRVEFDPVELDVPLSDFVSQFTPMAKKFDMDWRLALSDVRPRMAILVSRYDHCLVDLLYRHQSGELACDIPCIVSNHPESRPLRSSTGFRSFLFPLKRTTSSPPNARLSRCSKKMLWISSCSPATCRFFPPSSSSLSPENHQYSPFVFPAFVGAKPYHQAFKRGVKLIGATSHYVTEVLDDGPIIEQDVVRVSHRDSVDDLIQKGRDLEKVVLSRAVRWHVENRVLLYGNKTVVFE